MRRIVLFDGVCTFCEWNVQFIIRRDPHALFLFTPLQSSYGQDLLRTYAISPEKESIILFEEEQYYTQSTAALKIARHLRGMYPFLYLFIIVPRPLRDVFYRFIAKNRYKWFGKQEHCMIPSEKEKSRFLL